ncbi:hypothetical protein K2X05_00955 [bacterium]|nr:hypothetical protein [bacterium]
MTKLGQEFISHPPTINRPEFLRFVDSSLREKQIAFLILDSAENYQNYQKDILSLTSDCIKLHLFFFISGDDSKILLYRPNSALLSQLEELGYRYVIFIRSGFLVKCERAVDSLITESLLHPEILFIHHSHPNLSNQIFLATVGSGRGALIDQHLIERPIGVVSYSLPHSFYP